MSNTEIIDPKRCKSPSGDQTRTPANEKEFDPHDHGMDDGYGLWGAVVHIFRYTFGAGVLALPSTMKTVGYMHGIILSCLVSIYYYYNMHILMSLEYRLCKRSRMKQITYSSLAEKTFENAPLPWNKFGTLVTKVLLIYFAVTAYTSSYLVVFAQSVQNLAKYLDWNLDTSLIITVVMVPILIFCMFQKLLKILVPFSAVTNLLSMVMALVLVVYSVNYRDHTAKVQPSASSFSLIPQAVAAYLQAIICTPSILPVKEYMKHPHQMGSLFGALNITGVTTTLLFTSFSLIIYFCFGDKVEDNVLSTLKDQNPICFTIFCLYALVMLVVYLLGFSVIFDNVWPDIEPHVANSKWKGIIEFGIRIALNVWAYSLAVGLKRLNLILTMSGTVAIIFEVSLIPALELALIIRSKRKCWWTIFKNLVIIVISVSIFWMSLVPCIEEIRQLNTQQQR